MKTFQPWQDAINLLSGAQPQRTARPGERFEVSTQPSRSESTRGRFWSSLKRFRLATRKAENCPEEGEANACQTIAA